MNIDYENIQNVTVTAATEWAKNLSVEDTQNLAVMIEQAQTDAIMRFSKGLVQGAAVGATLSVGVYGAVTGTKLAAKKIKELKARKEAETKKEN